MISSTIFQEIKVVNVCSSVVVGKNVVRGGGLLSGSADVDILSTWVDCEDWAPVLINSVRGCELVMIEIISPWLSVNVGDGVVDRFMIVVRLLSLTEECLVSGGGESMTMVSILNTAPVPVLTWPLIPGQHILVSSHVTYHWSLVSQVVTRDQPHDHDHTQHNSDDDGDNMPGVARITLYHDFINTGPIGTCNCMRWEFGNNVL